MLANFVSLVSLLTSFAAALPAIPNPQENGLDTGLKHRRVDGVSISDTKLLHTRAGPIVFQGCGGVMTALNDDLADMVTMAAKARDNVKAGNSYYKAIFGTDPNQSNVPSDLWIRDRYDAIASATQSAKRGIPTLRCDYNSQSDKRCQSRFSAPAMTQGSGGTTPTIWLCAAYWQNRLRIRDIALPRYGSRAPLDQFIPTAGLLLHEWTHALYETTDVKLKQTNAGQVAYGQGNTLLLQRETNGARRSRNNADSYRIFAAMVTLNARWSTDPSNLGDGHIELKKRAEVEP
ncbi:hypothetical protein BU16DRAFT_565598 [Lophium mytilinum]|uniref:Uncharacterized protein n=1 Tax=Lophium mytilinum TaxID=390894 RepID=A0A6A6QIM7_9PEZI|nr:hypothetical protein BU16DRAFT_565598 [Lophium mytilinum]